MALEDGGGACWDAAGGGAARGSAMCVMAWQMAQRMDWAPGGSCSGVRQLEQFTSIIMAVWVRKLDERPGVKSE